MPSIKEFILGSFIFSSFFILNASCSSTATSRTGQAPAWGGGPRVGLFQQGSHAGIPSSRVLQPEAQTQAPSLSSAAITHASSASVESRSLARPLFRGSGWNTRPWPHGDSRPAGEVALVDENSERPEEMTSPTWTGWSRPPRRASRPETPKFSLDGN